LVGWVVVTREPDNQQQQQQQQQQHALLFFQGGGTMGKDGLLACLLGRGDGEGGGGRVGDAACIRA
jgi:hypothetical protein